MKKSIKKKQLNNQGFTLVEVLIAMVVLAIISIPILSAFTGATQVNIKARRIENAITAANDIIEEAKSTPLEKLNMNEGTNYNYTYIGSDAYADLRVATGNGPYEYKITNKDSDGDDYSYFNGNNDEHFEITATFDPKFYTDVSDHGYDGSTYNNINSSGVSIYNDISNTGSYVYRDESTDENAVNELMGRNSDFAMENIQKTTNVDIDIAKVDAVGEIPIYVQIVRITALYELYDGLPSEAGTVKDTYEKTNIYELNRITPQVVEEETTDIAGNSTVNKKYIISSASKYENNLKKIYLFYNPFDRAEKRFDGVSEVTNFNETDSVKWCNDRVNINFYYDTSNSKTIYEQCEVYLIQQDIEYQKQENGVKYKMQLRDNNINVSHWVGSMAYDGNTNEIKHDTSIIRFKADNNQSKILMKNDAYNSIRQYLYTNVKNLTSSGIKENATNLMYRMTVQVKYRGEVIAEMTSTKIE